MISLKALETDVQVQQVNANALGNRRPKQGYSRLKAKTFQVEKPRMWTAQWLFAYSLPHRLQYSKQTKCSYSNQIDVMQKQRSKTADRPRTSTQMDILDATLTKIALGKCSDPRRRTSLLQTVGFARRRQRSRFACQLQRDIEV